MKLGAADEKYNSMRTKYYDLQKLYDKIKHFVPTGEEERLKTTINKYTRG